MTQQHLIIIRGNSGSGKTTVANTVRGEMREIFGRGSTMLVPQDVVRLDMLDVKDTSDNESIELIYEICEYGLKCGKHVILDGILDRRKYGEMLTRLCGNWSGEVHAYYLDIPLGITLERHDMRPQKDMFTKQEMISWYNADNKLNMQNEYVFEETVSAQEAAAKIIADCTRTQ
jgi:predicted kinase